MKKIVNLNLKKSIYGGKFKLYPWNGVMYSAIFGSSINGLLDLINQSLYLNNKNPLYSDSNMLNNSSNKLYLRTGKLAINSTLNFGTPFF